MSPRSRRIFFASRRSFAFNVMLVLFSMAVDLACARYTHKRCKSFSMVSHFAPLPTLSDSAILRLMGLFRCFSEFGACRIIKFISKVRCEIMKTLQDFQSDVSALQASVNDISTGMDTVLGVVSDLKGQVSDLKAQLAAGSPVSQEDLDALDAQVNEIEDKVAEVHAKEDSAKS